MMAKIWSRIGFVGTFAAILGLGLTVFKVPFGQYILLSGIVVGVVGKIASIVYLAKHLPCCPKCGERMQNAAKRVRTGGLLSENTCIVTCEHCGAEVDLIPLYKSNQL